MAPVVAVSLHRPGAMLPWMAHLIGSLGYFGVALLMAIENVVLPLPSELIMPLAGFDTATGRMTLLGVIVAGAFGSAVGALPVYWAARALGADRLNAFLRRHGKWLLVRDHDVQQANDHFRHRGNFAVFIAQLFPGVRGLIALPAGVARMNVAMFFVMNLAGTMIWCAVLAWLGRLLGSNYDRVDHIMGPLGWGLLAFVLVGGVVWLRRRRKAST